MTWPSILDQTPWPSPGSANGIDPFLLRALATRWLDHRPPDGAGVQTVWIPVLMELDEAVSAESLQRDAPKLLSVRGAYLGDRGARHCTALASEAFVRDAAKRGVRRLSLGLPIAPGRAPRRPAVPPVRAPRERPRCEADVLIGVIDTGCAFAHRHFRRDLGKPGTRILALWDQDERPAFGAAPAEGSVPADFGYGREVRTAELDALTAAALRHGSSVDEQLCYELAGYDDLRRRLAHGTHVLDIVAGPRSVADRVERVDGAGATSRGGADAAPDIVFVQLPRAAIQDSSAVWLGVQVLDALRYIDSCAGPHTRRIVVNLSYGSELGPHDGSSILERAMDRLIDQRGKRPRLEVAISAGNGFAARRHASFALDAGASRALTWRVPPGGQTPSHLELWFSEPIDAEDLRLTIEPPGSPDGSASHAIPPGEAVAWPDAASAACSVIFTRQYRDAGRYSALVTLAPTHAFDAACTTAAHGDWKVRVARTASAKSGPVEVHAYIARNDPDIGALRRGQPSFLIDAAYDPRRYLAAQLDDDPSSRSPVRRRGGLNGIATGNAVRVVAAHRSDGAHSEYSSSGPTAGPRTGPDWSGLADESPALRGILGAGTRSGSSVRIYGTSVAAPQVARRLAESGYVGPVEPPKRGGVDDRGDGSRIGLKPDERDPLFGQGLLPPVRKRA